MVESTKIALAEEARVSIVAQSSLTLADIALACHARARNDNAVRLAAPASLLGKLHRPSVAWLLVRFSRTGKLMEGCLPGSSKDGYAQCWTRAPDRRV